MQSNRLFEIIYILLDKKKVTASSLATHFEVSRRTICRDIDTLSAAGIPIYTERGRYGGIHLLEHYVLDKSLLSTTEQQDLLASLTAMKQLQYPDAKEVLSKVSQLLGKPKTEWVVVDFSHWGSDNAKQSIFSSIKQGILEQRILHFSYLNSYGTCTKHTIEPYFLWFKETSWYLKGYSLKHTAFRLYKITRIQELEITKQHFERKALPETTTIQNHTQPELTTLKLRFSKQIAYRIYEEFERSMILVETDGSLLVTVSYPMTDWLYGYLLSFGQHLTVLEPECIKKKLLTITREIIANY